MSAMNHMTDLATTTLSRTDALAQRAAHVMSSRQSNVRALAEPSIFVERGIGQRIWDVDGRELLDFAIAMGPGIWGHGHSEYLQAVHAQLDRLLYVQSGACQSELEVQAAEAIVAAVPSAEHVRFHLSGSEAVQMALRLARAFTGRSKFLRFAGHYHGWLDNVIGGVLNPDPARSLHAVESDHDPFHTSGRAEGGLAESYLIPWNDPAALDEALERHGHEIAVVLMEVFNSNGGGCMPEPGYLEHVRAACNRHGVLLCFDEIITGFRTAIGGAQSLVDVMPDLTIFGKAIAGGMPLAAIAGRRDIFALFKQNKVIGAGTFKAFPVSLAACVKTMELLARDDARVYRDRAAVQERLVQGLQQAANDTGHPLLIHQMPGNFCSHFTAAPRCRNIGELVGAADQAKAVRFRALLREEGVLQGLGNRWFVSFALSAADAYETVERAHRALKRL